MPHLPNRRFRRALQVAFLIACLVGVAYALLPQPPKLPTYSWGDKVEHILGFAALAILALAAFPGAPRWQIAERLSFLGAMVEVAQSIPGLGRDCDIRDWIADTVAVLVVVGVARLFAPRRR